MENNFTPIPTNWEELFSDPPTEGLEKFIVQDLRASGLEAETLKNAGVYIFSGKREDLKKVLGYSSYQGHELTRGFVLLGFPYFNSGGEVELTRFKVYPSIGNIKYLHPTGKPPIPYALPEVWEIATKPHKPIAITEGEKKALKLTQEGLPTIALSGVWNFKADKTAREEEDKYLLRELRGFAWEGRTTFIFYDADAFTNPKVRQALYELAFKLTALGAVVRVATWKASEGKGIDDYLAGKENPKEVLEEVIAKAKPVEAFVEREDLRLVIKGLASAEFDTAPEVFTSLIKALSKKVGLTPKELKTAVWREKLKKENTDAPPYTEEELKQAEELLKSPDLIKKWLEFIKNYYLGREKELLLVRLATLTRHFQRALSVVLTGTASVGKSKLIEAVLKTVHPEAVEDFTRTSETYLLYRKKPLSNVILTYYEIHGTKHTAHIIRTALSEGKLKLGTVIKTDRGLEPYETEKDTNGLVILSTFASGSLDWELNTRVLKIEITHDPELARKVLAWKTAETEANKEELERQARIWRAVDYLIKSVDIIIPFARRLAEQFPVEQERYLRDFDKVLLLIKASALLHQYQRPKDEKGRIIAQPEDYALVYELRDLIAEAVSPVPESVLRFLEVAKELVGTDSFGNPEYPTREQVRKVLKVSDSTIKRYIKYCKDEELINVHGRGKGAKIEALDIPEPVNPLPAPENVLNLTERSEGGETAQVAHFGSNPGEPIQNLEAQGLGENGSTAHEDNYEVFTEEEVISPEEVEEILKEVYDEDG